MARVRELGVWRDGVLLATLHAPKPGRVDCRYVEDVLNAQAIGTPLLSCSLPVSPGKLDAWPFIDGLLPEGQHRAHMAAMAGVPTHDLLGLLARFGRDVAGALVIATDGEAGTLATAKPYTDEQLTTAVAELDVHPLGLYDDSQLSLPGLQDKMLLICQLDGTWARPAHGLPSTHILKVNDRSHPGLVRSEHDCLQIARAAGLAAPPSEIRQFAGVDAIVVERFDRTRADSGETLRIHQEDACQALGIRADTAMGQGKYERFGGPTFRQVAALLVAYSDNADESLMELLDRAVFTVAIGNADAHGKNLALLHPTAATIALAPLYDTVPTRLWPSLSQQMGMSISGILHVDHVTAAHLASEAQRWGLAEDTAAERVAATLERLLHVVDSTTDAAHPQALSFVRQRLLQILAGHPAGDGAH